MLRHLRTFTPLLAGLAVVSVGIFFADWMDLYDHIPHLDKVLHVLGGIVAAWLTLALLQNDITRMSAWKQMLIIVGVSAFIGVVWEWAEFMSNATRTTYPLVYHYFHGGNIDDTMADLLCDISGAFLLSLWALRKERS